jgi:hypothetical protein
LECSAFAFFCLPFSLFCRRFYDHYLLVFFFFFFNMALFFERLLSTFLVYSVLLRRCFKCPFEVFRMVVKLYIFYKLKFFILFNYFNLLKINLKK